MGKDNRIGLIKEIEKMRDSKVISYITSDRAGLETRIAKDVLMLFYNHLNSFSDIKKIDLLIYSAGGDTLAAFGLVNHIREFCDKFNLLVPFRAHSAATLIALGADEIVMGKLGQLSPIDPSINSPFNPKAPNSQPNAPKYLPVSVEDVSCFIELAKKEIGLPEKDSVDILRVLGDKINPLALGTVYRAREQIGMLASKLLNHHWKEGSQVGNIIEILTRKLYSHDYLISRSEAKKELKLNIVYPEDNLEASMWNLVNEYFQELEINTPFIPDVALGTGSEKSITFKRGFIESSNTTDIYITKKIIKRLSLKPPAVPFPQDGFQENILFQGWSKE